MTPDSLRNRLVKWISYPLKALAWLLGATAVVLILYALYASIAYRDIPADVIEARYGSDDLKTLAIDGVQLRYRVDGSPRTDREDLLLLHSHYFSMRMWDQWIGALTPYYRVIRFDMTSHGLTGTDPSNDYSMERSQQLISALLDHLLVDQVSLVGSSLGGNMAFHFAAENPQQVEKLVLINSGGLIRESSRTSGTLPGWVDWVFPLLPPVVFEKLLTWMIVDDTLVDDAMSTEFFELFRREGNREAELARLRQFTPGDPDKALASITAPTLIMWGRENPQLPFSLAEQFSQKLLATSTRVRIYDDIGHVIPLEMPIKGASDLLAFLADDHDDD